MEDPNAPFMASLFAMYDNLDVSDDVIMDTVIHVVRRCHAAIEMLTARSRFLEAYRQFQHCDDILQERHTDRKIVTTLSEGDLDRRVFLDLHARTQLLHKTFEAQRSNAGAYRGSMAMTGVSPRNPTSLPSPSGTFRNALASTKSVEEVGPPVAPQQGGGGVLQRGRRRLSSMAPGLQSLPFFAATARPPITASAKHELLMDNGPRTHSRSESRHSEHASVGASTSAAQHDVGHDRLPILPLRAADLEPEIRYGESILDECGGRTITEHEKHEAWRDRAKSHMDRAVRVLQNAKQSILDMNAKTVALQQKREAAANAALSASREASNRARANSPTTIVPTHAEPPQRPSSRPESGRPSSGSRKKPSDPSPTEIIAKLESSMNRVRAASITGASPSPTKRAPSTDSAGSGAASPTTAQRRTSQSLGSIANNIVFRRRSQQAQQRDDRITTARFLNDGRPVPNASGDGSRVPRLRVHPDHPLFHQFQKEDRSVSSHSLGDEDDGDHDMDGWEDAAMLTQGSGDGGVGGLNLARPEPPSVEVLLQRDGEDDEDVSECSLTVARIAAKLDSRLSRLQNASHATKQILSDAIRGRLEERVQEQVATCKLHVAAPPIRLSADELERFLTPETVLSLKQRRTNSLFFPSLMEETVGGTSVTQYSSLLSLKLAPNWTNIPPKELMSSLELSVAALRLQCWWRGMLAVIERKRRSNAVACFVTLHHRQVDAVAVLVRALRFVVARKKVRLVKERVTTVNELRIELEWKAKTGGRRAGDDPLEEESGGGLAPNGWAVVGRSIRSKRRHRQSMGSSPTLQTAFQDGVFINPFPVNHPSHGVLVHIHRRVAARIIGEAYRQYVFRCFEDLQLKARQCMHHLVTGQYAPAEGHSESGGELWDEDEFFDGPFSGGQPFGDEPGGGLLAKYSGDVITKLDAQLRGEGCNGQAAVESGFVMLRNVKLSHLEAQRRAEVEAVVQEKKAVVDRQRRQVEQDLLEQQRRNDAVSLLQRVGRGFRRRHILTRAYNNFHDRNHVPLGVRLERMSLSLSGASTARQSLSETPRGEDRIASEISRLIAIRNPALLPERRREVHAQQERAVIMVQCLLACRRSSWRVRERHLHRCARIIQQAWRRLWQRQLQERATKRAIRSDFVLYTLN